MAREYCMQKLGYLASSAVLLIRGKEAQCAFEEDHDACPNLVKGAFSPGQDVFGVCVVILAARQSNSRTRRVFTERLSAFVIRTPLSPYPFPLSPHFRHHRVVASSDDHPPRSIQ